MGKFGGARAWCGLGLLSFVPSIYAGQCNFKRIPPETKTLVQVYQRAEKLTLGDQLPKTNSKAETLIYRAKTKSWASYAWDFRPLDLLLAVSAQRDYAQYCGGNGMDLVAQLAQDFKNETIPEIDAKFFLRSLLLATPCLEGENLKLAHGILTRDFVENTDSFVDLLVATESEAPRFQADYKACSAPNENSKHILVDSLLPALERIIQGRGQNKDLMLRLSRVRASRMHFETAKYLIQSLDSFLAD